MNTSQICRRFLWVFGLATVLVLGWTARSAPARPNVVVIYADDVGWGDLGCYGARTIPTPHLDRLAREGVRFTDAHAPAATCTPSRFALLSGMYAWRQKGTGVLPGDAALILDPAKPTLASVFQRAGYRTGVVGKWHLGLGPGPGKTDWNGEIKPGPLELGFEHAFLMPATGDRVPCVYVQDRRVVGLDPLDPIRVSFKEPITNEPTGRANPELLKMHPSHGHDMTIVHGISRIGYMSGGRAARWKDEEMSDDFARAAVNFIERHRTQPFFLYLAPHGIHVPRVPHPRFVGKTPHGPRGDAMMELDDCVGQVLVALDRFGLARDTLVLFSSDNGPVVDDGYRDDAVNRLAGHQPAGPWRGGKYSRFEGGTRVPMLVRWPARVKPAVSDALMCHVDFTATFAALLDQPFPTGTWVDAEPHLPALLGESPVGRDHVVAQAGGLALREGRWKYIPGGPGPKRNEPTDTELGNDPSPQLYDLQSDPGEVDNLAPRNPERIEAMRKRLETIRNRGGG